MTASIVSFSVLFRDEDDDVMIAGGARQRVKLLQFHTDIRPAYFGTWSRRSQLVRARRPLGQDIQLFDYEVDSADEWEEEEPGESVDSGDDVSRSITIMCRVLLLPVCSAYI